MVLAKHGIVIEATTITLDATVTLTITNVYQLNTIPYLCILQYVQFPIIVEVMLKGPTS